ncbi:hypothetical protein BW716_25355 [[Flexibacter] sp. ATCC 35208]|nr:hypothetical protein BW716_25355 [[Flexibacter] sp. ATCC 35208]
MYKSLLFILLAGVVACNSSGKKSVNTPDSLLSHSVSVDTGIMTEGAPPVNPEAVPDTVRIEGDFNGDGNLDLAYGVLYRKAMEKEGQDEYVIRFSNPDIKPLVTGFGEIRLINEGDLNNDGRDDLSVYQAPLHGCTYVMSSWSFTKSGWKQLTDPWLVYNGCNYLSDEDLQNRIVLEDGILYYYQEDPNDEHMTLVKKEMGVK